MSFDSCVCYASACRPSCVQLSATLWTVARQAPLSMGFSGRNTGAVCHFPLQGIFPDPGIKPMSCNRHLRQCIWSEHSCHLRVPSCPVTVVRNSSSRGSHFWFLLPCFESFLFLSIAYSYFQKFTDQKGIGIFMNSESWFEILMIPISFRGIQQRHIVLWSFPKAPF